MARDEQQGHGAHELLPVHPTRGIIAGDQPREQVVRGAGPTLGHEAVQVLDHLHDGLRGLAHVLLGHDAGR